MPFSTQSSQCRINVWRGWTVLPATSQCTFQTFYALAVVRTLMASDTHTPHSHQQTWPSNPKTQELLTGHNLLDTQKGTGQHPFLNLLQQHTPQQAGLCFPKHSNCHTTSDTQFNPDVMGVLPLAQLSHPPKAASHLFWLVSISRIPAGKPTSLNNDQALLGASA